MRPALLILAGLTLSIVLVACEPVTQGTTFDATAFSDLTDIPAEFGELEAVTAVPEYPGWFQLWFEDNAGTIRMVRVQMFENAMHPDVKVIPRSGAMAEEVSDEG